MPLRPSYGSSLSLSVLIIITLFSGTGATCPPFGHSPPFPFSASPGCGHPSFPLKCASPHSILTVNNVSFSVVRYDEGSSSITLSPRRVVSSTKNCSGSIPTRPISFSGSPFRVSDASCSRISLLRPCSPPNLPNCSRCPWECKIVKSPIRLLRDCGSDRRRPVSEQGCQGDVLSFLDEFLGIKIGIEVDWDLSSDPYFSRCRSCEYRNGVCGFNDSDPDRHFLCFHSNDTTKLFSVRAAVTGYSPGRVRTVEATVLTLTCLLLVVAGLAAAIRSRQVKSVAVEEDPTAVFLHRHRHASLLPPSYTYDELEAATNRFDPNRKIGDGGFGSVFLGQLLDNRIVAVKHLHRNHQHNGSFCNEILILSSIHHPNLVRLHGYCSDPRGLLLIYDYVPNGTLADHLHRRRVGSGPMTWRVRVDIALQTALAIEYLHFAVAPPVVHRDVTSSNIFVEKDMRIKVGDFGLSRLLILPETTSDCVWTGPQGTPGYLDPDYHRSFRLTEKSDVYSFGVVLLELVSGMKAVDLTRDKREVALADLAVSRIQTGLLRQVVDPSLASDGEAMDGVEAVAELAFRCVAADKDDRPDAREIVVELKRIRARTRGLCGSNSSSGLVLGGGSGPVDMGKV